MNITDRINKLADEGAERTISIRREIHRHPELCFNEYNTAKIVRDELESAGIPYEISPVETGTIALIDSGKPGKLLLLRADMDALPINEQTGLDFASEVPDVMHACGHDVHTANLLAVGRILNEMKNAWSGRIKLVFQPAEEHGGGGREMIKAGLFDEMPDACIAMHVAVDPEGTITIGSGSVSAFTDTLNVTIHGRSGHSSRPETGVDAIQIAALVITAIYQVVSKNIDPLDCATLNVGMISGGMAGNIIPDKVQFRVMARNATKSSRDTMFEHVAELARGIAESMGGSAELEYNPGYEAVVNDEKLSEWASDVIRSNSDKLFEGIGEKPKNYLVGGSLSALTGEDFGFYAEKAPSCFITVGTGESSPPHTEKFMVNEDYIKLMTRAMSLLAVEFMNDTSDNGSNRI